MSNAIKGKRLPMAQVVMIVLVILEVFIINIVSPFISRAYAHIFHGQPIIPLTGFVINVFPIALLFLLPVIFVLLFRCLGNLIGRSVFLCFVLVMICGLYIFGLVLPFFYYPIGLQR
ncbi:MAG: hypothetical protein IJH50_13070 [Kiritimatiellae bacterium]|nr:hypothetical protein [Kiritimatiellia bacterium]